MQTEYSLFYPFLVNKVPAGESVRNHKYKDIKSQMQVIEKILQPENKPRKSRSHFPVLEKLYNKNDNSISKSFQKKTSLNNVNLKFYSIKKKERNEEKLFKADLYTNYLLQKDSEIQKSVSSMKNKLPTLKTKEINSNILNGNGDMNYFYKNNINLKNVLDFDKYLSKRFIC